MTERLRSLNIGIRLGSFLLCNAGDAANSGDAAAVAETLKTAKYTEIVNKGYIFQPVAFDAQGESGPSTTLFLYCILS